MNPDENLREQLAIVARMEKRAYLDAETEATDAADDADRLADLVSALDGWLRGGGFLPKAWQR